MIDVEKLSEADQNKFKDKLLPIVLVDGKTVLDGQNKTDMYGLPSCHQFRGSPARR